MISGAPSSAASTLTISDCTRPSAGIHSCPLAEINHTRRDGSSADTPQTLYVHETNRVGVSYQCASGTAHISLDGSDLPPPIHSCPRSDEVEACACNASALPSLQRPTLSQPSRLRVPNQARNDGVGVRSVDAGASRCSSIPAMLTTQRRQSSPHTPPHVQNRGLNSSATEYIDGVAVRRPMLQSPIIVSPPMAPGRPEEFLLETPAPSGTFVTFHTPPLADLEPVEIEPARGDTPHAQQQQQQDDRLASNASTRSVSASGTASPASPPVQSMPQHQVVSDQHKHCLHQPHLRQIHGQQGQTHRTESAVERRSFSLVVGEPKKPKTLWGALMHGQTVSLKSKSGKTPWERLFRSKNKEKSKDNACQRQSPSNVAFLYVSASYPQSCCCCCCCCCSRYT